MPEAKAPQQAGPSLEEQRQREHDARYAEAIGAVEKLAAAWDFRGAGVELGRIRFEEPELTARLVQRRDELKRMHGLKQKIIAAVNAATPPINKGVLGLKGLGGEVTKADQASLTCKLINGKEQTVAWADVGEKAVPKLLDLGIDRASGDDWLAAGLVGLACRDAALVEKSFDRAPRWERRWILISARSPRPPSAVPKDS